MTTIPQLTPDEVLSTTRAVRRRLDLERPVEIEVLEECLRFAQQAPAASYRESWHFVVVTDAGKRAALGELWRKSGERYLAARRPEPAADLPPNTQRLLDSVWHLVDHIGDVPVHVIPCIEGRTDGRVDPGAGVALRHDRARRVELHARRARPRPRPWAPRPQRAAARSSPSRLRSSA